MAKNFIEFGMKSTRELTKALRKLGEDVERAAAASLYQSANKIMLESKETYCPIDTGALKASGNVGLPEINNHKINVPLGYGNSSVDYAIYVHEMNKNYRNGKQWKYLETPLKARLPDVETKLRNDIEKAMKG
jgi:hypothetical protein